MKGTNLFILFPAFSDVERDDATYVHCYDIKSDNDIDEYIEKIASVKDFFDYEDYSGFYDSDNVRDFSIPLSELEDCYPNKLTRLRSLLRDWENWRDDALSTGDDKFLCFSIELRMDILGEMFLKKKADEESSFLLLNHGAFDCKSPYLIVSNGKDSKQIDVCNVDIINIHNWLSNNRKPQRIFHLNPKHGEKGVGAHPGNKGDKVSHLLCTEQEAYKLLSKSIGSSDNPSLYFYDDDNKSYIEFKRESENTYHAFHLEGNDWKRIPESVVRKIEKVK